MSASKDRTYQTHESLPTIPMDSSLHFRSSWREPIGKPLSNRAIAEYARLGRYGPEAQRRAKASHIDRATGRIIQCCGAQIVADSSGKPVRIVCNSVEVKFLRWNYLPKSGYYCKACVARYREESNKEQVLSSKIRAARLVEYV